MFRWHYGLVAVLGLVVGYIVVRGVSLVAWMNAPVKVVPHTVRLGEMVEGNDASFSVNLINRTDQPLRLVRVHYSVCGCFFEQEKLPEVIAPHSNVPLAFGVQTGQLPDRFRAQLTFVLTDPYGVTFTPAVTLIGSVRREIAITPAFIDFGTVLLGVTSRTVSLQGLTGKVFKVADVEAPPEVSVSHPNNADTTLQLQVHFPTKALFRLA